MSGSESAKTGKSGPNKDAERAERLAAELRANLARRKAQQKAQKKAHQEFDSPEQGAESSENGQ